MNIGIKSGIRLCDVGKMCTYVMYVVYVMCDMWCGMCVRMRVVMCDVWCGMCVCVNAWMRVCVCLCSM